MKPILNKVSIEEIAELEKQGVKFKRYENGKRIVARAMVLNHQVILLEDDSEIIKAPNGEILEEWPEIKPPVRPKLTGGESE